MNRKFWTVVSTSAAVALFLGGQSFADEQGGAIESEEEKLPLVVIEKPEDTESERFLDATEREIEFNGKVVREVVLSKEYLTVAYKNMTGSVVIPGVEFKIYNRYGFQICSGEEMPNPIDPFNSSLVPTGALGPKDVGSERLVFKKWINLGETKTLFGRSAYQVPEDFMQPRWISISESFRKIE